MWLFRAQVQTTLYLFCCFLIIKWMEEVVTSEYILFQTSIKNEKKELTMMQKLKSKHGGN